MKNDLEACKCKHNPEADCKSMIRMLVGESMIRTPASVRFISPRICEQNGREKVRGERVRGRDATPDETIIGSIGILRNRGSNPSIVLWQR